MRGVVTSWKYGSGAVTGSDGNEYFIFHKNIIEGDPERLQIG